MGKTQAPYRNFIRTAPVSAAIVLILVLTAWRIVMLWFNDTDLFFDEAQYWLWGRSFEFGYFSKPPLIAWVIRASTEIGSSNSEFWIRLPGPLFHAVAALIIMATARTLSSARTAAIVGAAYITIPAVTFGSQIISTDTVLIPFFALALLAFLRLSQTRSVHWALLLGMALGFGAMAKYAMAYFVICAALVSVLFPTYRIGWRNTFIAAVIAVAMISPNILWNVANDLSTVRHTAENVAWKGIRLNWSGFGEFLAGQFAVFGPILFAGYLWICHLALKRRLNEQNAMLVTMSLPILVIISVQSIISQANANWAAMTYVGATIVTVTWLLENRRRLLFWSFALHLTVAIILPISTVFPDRISLFEVQVFERILGRTEFADKVIAIADDNELNIILAERREVLADLFYHTHGTGQTVYSAPRKGRRAHHYSNSYPFPTNTDEPVLLLTRNPNWLPCLGSDKAAELERWTPATGAYRGKEFVALKIKPSCWTEQRPL